MRRTLAERLKEYDRHNPFCRFSDDPILRVYGKCGCRDCAATREEWSVLPAPINQQHREGTNSMAGINVCDRCNAMVKGIALGAIQLRTSADSNTNEILSLELCPACVSDALTLIESMPTTDRERAYITPFRRPVTEPDAPALDLEKMIQNAVNQRMKEIEG